TRFSRDWSSDVCSSDLFFSKEIDSLRNNLASFSNLTVPVRTRWEAALLPFSDFSRSDTTLDKSSLKCLYVSFIDMPRTPPFRVRSEDRRVGKYSIFLVI